jgi:mono/diheme cytochrome c family protein
MWNAMSAAKIQTPDVNAQAAADLFAFFYSTRFFEKPGDAARGKRVFASAGCAGCHGLTAEIQPGIPPVSRWENLNHPFTLSEAMWNHMRPMLQAVQAKKMKWPSLTGQDLADLLVYLRNLPAARDFPPRVEISAGENGRALFQAKGCVTCHGNDTLLAGRIQGLTLTEIAADMWDHGPRMAALKAPPATFQAGEMRELLSYIWARQFFQDAHDPVRGKSVFKAKHCTECHESGAAPKLPIAGHAYTGPTMIAALWHHGQTMLGQMQARGIPWPRLDAADMSGLIAYLNLTQKEKP